MSGQLCQNTSRLKKYFKIDISRLQKSPQAKAGYTQPGAGSQFFSNVVSVNETGTWFPHGKTCLSKSNQRDTWWNDGSASGGVWVRHHHWHSLGAPLPLISFAWPLPPLALPLLWAGYLTLWVTSRTIFRHIYSRRAAGDTCELCRQDGVAVCRLICTAGTGHNPTSLTCFIWGMNQSPSCCCLAFPLLFRRLL